MENDKVIVAIELGSSKISGIAGQILFDGSLKVLAYAGVPSSSCIRHGAVYNLEKTGNAIVDVINRLEATLSTHIQKVYVGYNAKGLRSVISKVAHTFDEETVVSQEVLDDMFDQCSVIEYDGYVNLYQESQEYVVDNKRVTETDPMGVACRKLEGNYLNILLKKQVADYIAQCFNMAQVEIVDGYVSPMVQADAVLTDDDRQQGCALVDYGADTTTVSVYKNGMLRYLRVIPLGSALITRDLSSILKIEFEQAERLKCTYGLCNLVGSQDAVESIMLNGKSVTLKEISDIIEARNEEIVRNVLGQIKQSGFGEVLYAGIILTGGGSQLRNLEKVFEQLNHTMRTPRIMTEPTCGVTWNESRWRLGDGSQLSLLSVMANGDESCCELPKMDAIDNLVPENQDQVIQQSLFTDNGESAQEERDRKEEEERKEREAQQAQMEAQKAAEEETKKSNNRTNRFKSWYNSFLNASETFFEDKDDNNTKN